MFSKKELPLIPYTVEQCTSCKFESKRNFKIGDYVFQETSSCASCDGKMQITQIFGKSI